ncbi:MAG: hypothetical protein ACRENO_05650 [Thermodesulfobacteriota bacterium]
MLNALILLFLAYLNPNYELKTTLVDTVYLTSDSNDIEIIRNKNELDRIKKIYGENLKLPEIYFIDELLVIKKLGGDVDPETFKIVKTLKDKNGNYNVLYTIKEKDYLDSDAQQIKSPYLVLKLKPVSNHKADIKITKLDITDPIIANQSLGTTPSFAEPLDRVEGSFFIGYFPLDNGNSWTYKYGDEGALSKESTFKIVAFSEGWSFFDSFFGKKNIALRFDNEGNLLLANDKRLRSFYNEAVTIEKSNESITVEAGTFNDLVVVSIPENEQFWFKDIYASGIGLIYHEHHSPKGSSYYHLNNAKVRGKTIP